MTARVAVLMSAFAFWVAGLAQVALADRADDLDRLFAALMIDETVAIMREEGEEYGAELSRNFLGGEAGAGWAAEVARIYDPDRMGQVVRADMSLHLEGVALSPLIDYFESDAGRRILTLELSARRAFMDPDTEEAAMIRYEEAVDAGAPIVGQIEMLITDSDLLERNVTGGLNANLMFFRGMAAAGGYDGSDDDMLREVWTQEEEMRESTRDWLHAFLMMAYHPLEPEVVDGYAEFYRSYEGRALNHALFEAFNKMYDELSFLTGGAIVSWEESEQL